MGRKDFSEGGVGELAERGVSRVASRERTITF